MTDPQFDVPADVREALSGSVDDLRSNRLIDGGEVSLEIRAMIDQALRLRAEQQPRP
jgi:hypothetical protein